ncbi:MAG: hypothetical protein OEV92_05870 [Nitrospinota bacterium]|nr:hypothetical protein [Nitrospinota bacterium]
MKAGADPNLADNNGNTVFEFALGSGSIAMMKAITGNPRFIKLPPEKMEELLKTSFDINSQMNEIIRSAVG